MQKRTESGRYEGYVSDLVSHMVVSEVLLAYQQPRKNARLYAYSDILRSSCSEVFRWRDGCVWAFDGRIWCRCPDEDFKYVVRDALVRASGVGSEIVKSDWVDSERKIYGYALDGVKLSPLEYNSGIVGFSNGVWDFTDVGSPVRHEFSDRMPVTHLLPYRFDPKAVCPVWESFLHSMLPDGDIAVLQKFFGLGCTDRKTMSHRVEDSLWLIGSGANGKTTIQNVIRMVFGDENVGSTRLDALLDRNIDARMRATGAIEGLTFNMCEEISGTDIEKGSDIFKSLCSGEPQDVRGIGKDIHRAYDIPFLVFSMNQMPANKRMDDAFRRRMVRIDFRSSVRQDDMDRELGSKLASELSGIRNWALAGYSMLVDDSFRVRKSGNGVTDEDIEMMVSNGHTVDAWKEHMGISDSRHVGHEDDEDFVLVSVSDLYSEYDHFCQHRLMCQPVTTNQFGRDLRRLHFESKRMSGGMCYRVWCDKRNRMYVQYSQKRQ